MTHGHTLALGCSVLALWLLMGVAGLIAARDVYPYSHGLAFWAAGSWLWLVTIACQVYAEHLWRWLANRKKEKV